MGANESEDDVHPRCLKESEDGEMTLGDLRKRRVQVSSVSVPTTRNSKAAKSIQAITAALGY
jgi:hypothetical protein